MHEGISDRSLCLSGAAITAFITIISNPTSRQISSLEMLEILKLKSMHNDIELEVHRCICIILQIYSFKGITFHKYYHHI